MLLSSSVLGASWKRASPPPHPHLVTHPPPSSVDGKTTLAPPGGCGRGSGGGRQRPAVNKGGKKTAGSSGEGRGQAASRRAEGANFLPTAPQHLGSGLFGLSVRSAQLRQPRAAPGLKPGGKPGDRDSGRRTRGDTRPKVAHSWGRKVSGSGVFGGGPDGGLRLGLPSPFPRSGPGAAAGRGRGRRRALERAPAADTGHTCG